MFFQILLCQNPEFKIVRFNPSSYYDFMGINVNPLDKFHNLFTVLLAIFLNPSNGLKNVY